HLVGHGEETRWSRRRDANVVDQYVDAIAGCVDETARARGIGEIDLDGRYRAAARQFLELRADSQRAGGDRRTFSDEAAHHGKSDAAARASYHYLLASQTEIQEMSFLNRSWGGARLISSQHGRVIASRALPHPVVSRAGSLDHRVWQTTSLAGH